MYAKLSTLAPREGIFSEISLFFVSLKTLNGGAKFSRKTLTWKSALKKMAKTLNPRSIFEKISRYFIEQYG